MPRKKRKSIAMVF